jgi:hypothetical protein
MRILRHPATEKSGQFLRLFENQAFASKPFDANVSAWLSPVCLDGGVILMQTGVRRHRKLSGFVVGQEEFHQSEYIALCRLRMCARTLTLRHIAKERATTA